MSKSHNSTKNLLLLVGIIFLTVAIFTFNEAIAPIEYYKISKSGKLYSAIVERTERTIASYNEQAFIRAFVYYTDENGQEKAGYTSYCYPSYDCPREGSVVMIRELDGKIVEDNFNPSGVYTASALITILFGITGLILILIPVVTLILNYRKKRIIVNGVKSTGTFIEAKTNMSVNGQPVYRVTFSFIGRYNKEKVTTTSARYYADDVYKLEMMKNFEIYVLGDIATITQDLSSVEIIDLKQQVAAKRQYCTQCGRENVNNYTYCENCGNDVFSSKDGF